MSVTLFSLSNKAPLRFPPSKKIKSIALFVSLIFIYFLSSEQSSATPFTTAVASPSPPPGSPGCVFPRDLPTISLGQDTTVLNTAAFNYVFLADRTF